MRAEREGGSEGASEDEREGVKFAQHSTLLLVNTRRKGERREGGRECKGEGKKDLRSDCPLVAFGIVCLGSSKVLPTAYVRKKKRLGSMHEGKQIHHTITTQKIMLVRLYETSIKVLLRLYETSIKALLRGNIYTTHTEHKKLRTVPPSQQPLSFRAQIEP